MNTFASESLGAFERPLWEFLGVALRPHEGLEMLGVQGSFWVTLYSLYLNGEQEPQINSFLGLLSLDHGLGCHGGVTNQSTMSPDTKTTVTTAEYPYLYMARQAPSHDLYLVLPTSSPT